MTLPLRRALLAFSLIPLLAGLGAPAVAGESGTPIPCATAQAGFENAQLVCDLPPSGQAQTLRLHVAFQGVHDDSSAALNARLEERTLTCSDDSRPRIDGEGAGDTVSCKFSVPAGDAARQLRIQIVWHHAEPVAFELRKD